MRLIESVAGQIQDQIKRRVWEQTKVLRESLLKQMEESIRTAVNQELAKALVDAADVAVRVDLATQQVIITTAVEEATGVDSIPVVESAPAVDVQQPLPFDIPADPGRGAA